MYTKLIMQKMYVTIQMLNYHRPNREHQNTVCYVDTLDLLTYSMEQGPS